MEEDRKIMLVFNPKAGFQHDVIEGVRQYLARLPNWSLKGVYQDHREVGELVRHREARDDCGNGVLPGPTR